MKHRLTLGILIATISFSACSDSKAPAPAVTHPTLGPDNAVLSIEQFSDFYCPYCKKQAQVLKKVIEAYPDKIRLSFRHLPISGEPGVGSFPIHEASMCANEQNKFWEFQDFVFALKGNANLDEMVKAIHLNQSKFDTCFKVNRYRTLVLDDIADAQKRGVSGTPTFFMNGEMVSGLRPFEYFAQKVDPALAKKKEAERQRKHAEMLKKINFSDEGRPARGPEKASVTIVEFSDLHCFYCQKMAPVIDQIMKAYPQDVRRLWRHFPLPIHPQSPYAHVATECAHAQGKFWEFRDKVFADMGKAHTHEDLVRIAEELKLDLPLFETCSADIQTKKKIENDVLLGFSKKIGSTPTLVINDEVWVGAMSVEDLKVIIDQKRTESQKLKN